MTVTRYGGDWFHDFARIVPQCIIAGGNQRRVLRFFKVRLTSFFATFRFFFRVPPVNDFFAAAMRLRSCTMIF